MYGVGSHDGDTDEETGEEIDGDTDAEEESDTGVEDDVRVGVVVCESVTMLLGGGLEVSEDEDGGGGGGGGENTGTDDVEFVYFCRVK
ncbi:hypothetical protein OGAPHI_003478 [Ogataea philodendri]|uniref:Uncharacterized protein n=1 Tax=Ogataea philodendri TaxID=1378263 RepID=A0A9P8P6Z4_9ASCO|nr:uncharacterized protein OGAPHI_003478 [Ogataea philodendri]KAH3666482.1 hypothetical protein OGAPHI_003478 [Ogataea philodendri]